MIQRLSLVAVLVACFARPVAAQDISTYVACSAAQAVTAAADMLHLEAGPDRGVLVHRVWIVPGTQTTAGYHQYILRTTTAASTGGSLIVPAPVNPLRSVFTGIVRYGAAGGGTDGSTLVGGSYFVSTTTTINNAVALVLFDAAGSGVNPLRINKGGTTGIEVRNATGGAGGANHYACVLFTEDNK